MSSQGPLAVTEQCAGAVLMIRPARFGFNPQTADSNRFATERDDTGAAGKAREEFDAFAGALRDAGVRVCIAEDTPEPARPDAVFPNNWVSFHGDGTVVLYPMQAANRRRERRMDLLFQVQRELGYRCLHLLDLSAEEEHGRFLEGTGSLVLDHVGRVAYACRSSRTDESLAREWSAAMRYELEIFDASGMDGTPVYHTNVLLSIGARYALLCSDAVAPRDRERVRARLAAGGRVLVDIDTRAMREFAGNILELRVAGPGDAPAPRTVLVMSARARAALGEVQWQQLEAATGAVLAVPVPVIETVGGGGARCMLAEVPDVLR